MADPCEHKHPVCRALTPEAILAIGAVLFYGWSFVPAEHQANAWNVLGSAVRLWLLWSILLLVKASKMTLAIAAWWTAEELMVIGGSLGRIWWPWPVKEGQSQISALLNLDVGSVTILIVAALCGAVVRRSR